MEKNYYNEIKNELLNNEIYKIVKNYSKNRNELSTYYNVGKLLIEAQGGENRAKYGNGLIKKILSQIDGRIRKRLYLYSLIKNEAILFISRKNCASGATINLVPLLWIAMDILQEIWKIYRSFLYNVKKCRHCRQNHLVVIIMN